MNPVIKLINITFFCMGETTDNKDTEEENP
jgi:hypothetical protein